MRGRNLTLAAFTLSIGAITYWHMKKCHELPWPPQFIYTGLVFFILYIISLFNEEVGGVSTIGFVIAIFVKQGWIADCEHGGTGQPQLTGFIGNPQPPSVASITEYQQQTGPGGAPSTQPGVPPGVTIV